MGIVATDGHYRALPRLSEAKIIERARAWRILYGVWPASLSGPIGNTGETWVKVDVALRNGLRGLTGGSSLSRLIRAKVLE